MVLIEINSNAILVEGMKNRTTGEMIRAYQVLVERLRSAGVTPKMHILDNECSAKFKERIKSNNMKCQLVPSHDHRRNIAEKAIQVFKAHFISISAAQTSRSHFTYGTDSSDKQNIPSTCSGPQR